MIEFWRVRLKKFDKYMEKPSDIYTKYSMFKIIQDHYWFFINKLKSLGYFEDRRFNYANLYRSWQALKERFNSDILTDKFQKWDQIFKDISEFRNRVAHNPNEEIPEEKLRYWRKNAPIFVGFAATLWKKYQQPSRDKKNALEEIIQDVELILNQFLTRYPLDRKYRFFDDLTFFTEFLSIDEQMNSIEELKLKIESMSNLQDLNHEDFYKIFELVEVIGKLKGREYTFHDLEKCPLCGSDFLENEEGIMLLVKCEGCGYTVHEEPLDINFE